MNIDKLKKVYKELTEREEKVRKSIQKDQKRLNSYINGYVSVIDKLGGVLGPRLYDETYWMLEPEIYRDEHVKIVMDWTIDSYHVQAKTFGIRVLGLEDNIVLGTVHSTNIGDKKPLGTEAKVYTIGTYNMLSFELPDIDKVTDTLVEELTNSLQKKLDNYTKDIDN